jgi:Fe-S oxidoreductase
MATYKAEFLAHYYEGRLRPRHAYSMGLIHWWARIASRAPRIANFVSHAPLLSAAFKWIGGIAPQREVPRFAAQTFRSWFERRPRRNRDGERVLLWADTFNNFFHPEAAKAAVLVLEHLGYDVAIQAERLCCGRPLYDYGMLELARAKLRQILDGMHDEIARGTKFVGLEPSCVAVFRDEMVALLPHDEDAQRLSKQTRTFAEFLMEHDFRAPALRRKAIVHGHCHDKSVLGFDKEKKLLERLGVDAQVLDDGCCGMAGSFGFEKGKYDVSMKIGERKYLPAARKAPADTLLVADGFSCREQVEQGAGRKAMHVAEVASLALGQAHAIGRARRPRRKRIAIAAGVAVAAFAAAVWARREASGQW